jgi:hypothetical protein
VLLPRLSRRLLYIREEVAGPKEAVAGLREEEFLSLAAEGLAIRGWG